MATNTTLDVGFLRERISAQLKQLAPEVDSYVGNLESEHKGSVGHAAFCRAAQLIVFDSFLAKLESYRRHVRGSAGESEAVSLYLNKIRAFLDA